MSWRESRDGPVSKVSLLCSHSHGQWFSRARSPLQLSEQRPPAFRGPCAQAQSKDRTVINAVNLAPAEGAWTALPVCG